MRNICFTFCSFESLVLLMFLFLIVPSASVFGQVEKSNKEVINITSTFKPSIVKTGKIEFQAEPLKKDTSAYEFVYPTDKVQFLTPMRSFSIRPLSFKQDQSDKDSSNLFAKLGYGNLSTPFISLGFQRDFSMSNFSATADHISSKGNLPDQEVQHTAVAVRLKYAVSDHQSIGLFTGFDRDAYKLYGFDHLLFNPLWTELDQHFNNFNFGAAYQIVAGEKITFSPAMRLDLLSASRDVKELIFKFNSPLTYALNDAVRFLIEPKAELMQLTSSLSRKTNNSLIQIPLFAYYSKGFLQVKGGLVPVISSGEIKMVPDFSVSYSVGQSGLKVKGGVSNTFNLNSYHLLYGVNQFVIPPDSLTVSHNTDYFVGIDWLNGKGLQVRLKTGIIQYRNQPLFINRLGDGKSFTSILDQSFTALNFEAGTDVKISSQLAINASLQAMSFADFTGQMKAYGILPFTLSAGLSWKLFKDFKLRGTAFLWQGAMARTTTVDDFRAKGAVDISLGLEYNLNKKWALWVDLNNIANISYQRWNQYPSFGFNAIGGVRYSFHK